MEEPQHLNSTQPVKRRQRLTNWAEEQHLHLQVRQRSWARTRILTSLTGSQPVILWNSSLTALTGLSSGNKNCKRHFRARCSFLTNMFHINNVVERRNRGLHKESAESSSTVADVGDVWTDVQVRYGFPRKTVQIKSVVIWTERTREWNSVSGAESPGSLKKTFSQPGSCRFRVSRHSYHRPIRDQSE